MLPSYKLFVLSVMLLTPLAVVAQAPATITPRTQTVQPKEVLPKLPSAWIPTWY